MHHPLDVAGGVIIGIGAILLLLLRLPRRRGRGEARDGAEGAVMKVAVIAHAARPGRRPARAAPRPRAEGVRDPIWREVPSKKARAAGQRALTRGPS